MKQPNQLKSLKLSKSEQKLFDEHQDRALKVFRKYRRFCPDAHHEDFHQHLLILLARCAQRYESYKPRCEFGAYAWDVLCREARMFLFSQRRFNSAALKNAEKHELSASEPVGKAEDGKPITRGERADNLLGIQDQSPTHDHLAATLHDIREALKKVRLTPRERKVLQLRGDGLAPEQIAAKMRLGKKPVWQAYRSVIAKLRVHFATRGALPPDAPLPADRGPRGSYKRR